MNEYMNGTRQEFSPWAKPEKICDNFPSEFHKKKKKAQMNKGLNEG